MNNSVIIDSTDNVGVVIESIKKGEEISYFDSRNQNIRLIAREDIPIYHKFSICDIQANEVIVKYGQHIGQASTFIMQGQHVHTHNINSVRENLDEKV